jgi:hypothetical protein
VGPALVIADAFARAGDPSLYEFVTSDGAFGSEGGDKDLRFAARSLGRHLDGSYVRYGTDEEERAGDPAYLIDGRNLDEGWDAVHDVTVAMSNLYFRDDYLRGVYTRTGEGLDGYPQDPATNGPHTVWTGEGGIYPGVLFMFGQLEDEVAPY